MCRFAEFKASGLYDYLCDLKSVVVVSEERPDVANGAESLKTCRVVADIMNTVANSDMRRSTGLRLTKDLTTVALLQSKEERRTIVNLKVLYNNR